MTADTAGASQSDQAAPLRFDTAAAAAQAHLAAQGVRYVLAQFVDIHGVAKAKSVPLAHLNSMRPRRCVPRASTSTRSTTKTPTVSSR